MWYNRRKNRPGHGQGGDGRRALLYLAALESDGDKKQFRDLYRRYHRVMERTALAVLHDPPRRGGGRAGGVSAGD